jgi:hypothetical protein
MKKQRKGGDEQRGSRSAGHIKAINSVSQEAIPQASHPRSKQNNDMCCLATTALLAHTYLIVMNRIGGKIMIQG